MPLFTYKCLDCDHIMEKFQHDPDDEVVCPECESENCERQFGSTHNRTWLDAKDMLKEKIAPDAKRMMDNMRKGKDKEFFDVYGDK